MGQVMQEKSKGTLVFGVVAVLALGSTIAGAGLGRGAGGKLRATEARLLSERPAPVQGGGGAATKAMPPLHEYRIAKQDLEMARLSATWGHRTVEAMSLVTVLDRAERIDRARTLTASLLAAKLFDAVADHVDAAPSLLGEEQLVAALRRSSFGSSRRPLEAERRHALGVLAGVPAQVPIRTAGLAELAATQAMEDVNATLREMEDSAIAGNIAQCETAAQKPRGLAKQVTVGPSICRSAAGVAASGSRFRKLRARAVRA
jgi:hypothetical protein